ncbi:MAG TPA: hypothetical protein VKQ32_03395 [Polyangia bacterium]|nr:hypothetical protein [Polyangia bacterium]
MSATARLLWIIPALLVASWLAVRSLAASPARIDPPRRGEMGDPPVPFASLTHEVSDPALAHFIGGLAADARKN